MKKLLLMIVSFGVCMGVHAAGEGEHDPNGPSDCVSIYDGQGHSSIVGTGTDTQGSSGGGTGATR